MSDLPLVLNVAQAAQLMGVSRDKVYDMARTPGFPAVRHGRRILIPRDALIAWLERMANK